MGPQYIPDSSKPNVLCRFKNNDSSNIYSLLDSHQMFGVTIDRMFPHHISVEIKGLRWK